MKYSDTCQPIRKEQLISCVVKKVITLGYMILHDYMIFFTLWKLLEIEVLRCCRSEMQLKDISNKYLIN